MCGIVGYCGQFQRQLLQQMCDAVAHRGPDDQGSIFLHTGKGPVGLAHRRLKIIDLSKAGHQPMSVECPRCANQFMTPDDQKLWIVYNGELYNYREIRSDLEKRGHDFHSNSDTEVLLHLFSEKGTGMLECLNGIFAFAIYDGRTRPQDHKIHSGDLFLARDGLGVKPLYYSETKNGFLFASELKALLKCDNISRELDYIAINQYLTYLWSPAPRSPLKAVKKLKPGEAVIVREGKVTKRWRYYDLPYGQAWLSDSENVIADMLDRQLNAAVKRQMVADVPVGAFLSGGLDSSATVAMMRKSRPDYRPTCYCIGFDEKVGIEGSPPDLPYAQRVADHLDVELRAIKVNANIIQHLEKMIYYLDEPQADPAPIHVMLIAEQARNDGIKVLLSGTGGDDIFSGYRRHQALVAEHYWSWLPLAVRRIFADYARKSNDDLNITRRFHARDWYRRLKKVLWHADLSDEDRMMAYFFWSEETRRISLYAPDIKTKLMKIDVAEPLRESLKQIPYEKNALNRMLYLEAKHFLADHNLNYTDKASMAFGVEVRVPLLDIELINLAARIPPSMKQKGRVGKAIFKKAMEPYLPKDVIYRPKTGFGIPLRRWLHNEMRELVSDLLSSQSLTNRGLFEPNAVKRLLENDRSGYIDGAYFIFALVCIELWCRIFLDDRFSMNKASESSRTS